MPTSAAQTTKRGPDVLAVDPPHAAAPAIQLARAAAAANGIEIPNREVVEKS